MESRDGGTAPTQVTEALMGTVINIYTSQFDCEDEAKIKEIRAVIRDINLKLGRALGEPGSVPGTLRKKGEPMAKTLDEVLEAVRQASTRTDSIIADRAALKQQLDDALSGVTLPPAVQAAVDAIFDIEASDAAKIDAALSANVPPVEG